MTTAGWEWDGKVDVSSSKHRTQSQHKVRRGRNLTDTLQGTVYHYYWLTSDHITSVLRCSVLLGWGKDAQKCKQKYSKLSAEANFTKTIKQIKTILCVNYASIKQHNNHSSYGICTFQEPKALRLHNARFAQKRMIQSETCKLQMKMVRIVKKNYFVS